MSWDAIVIGAGVNGLAAAGFMARARRRVLVLERRAAEDGSADCGWIPPKVVRELGLDAHGLQVHQPDPWIETPLADGGRLELFRDVARSTEAIARLSTADARRWPEFCARMHQLARFLETLYAAPAPQPTSTDLGELIRLVSLGRRVRGLGRLGMVDLLRVFPMSAADLLDDWFEHDALKGALGIGAVTGLCQGPRSGGTAFLLLHHHVRSPVGVFRPPVLTGPATTGVEGVFGAAARALGAEIRRGTEVAHVLVRDDRASGVVLTSGEEIAAPLVVSSVDPRRTFLHLLDPGLLEPDFVRAVDHIRFRGAEARVTLTLGEPPGFNTLCVSPSLEYLERAYDATKYGRVSERPWIEARAVGRDAAGRYPVVLHVQYAPYRLTDGSWNAGARQALGDLAVRTLLAHVPTLERSIVGREVLTPVDLEDRYGATEGSLSHGELTLDQILFMRPVPGWAHYRTPVRGLYLCGAGTHPGGGIAGASGRLGAMAALRE
jgi:phytoene dehydrogenase-like protein